MKVVIAGAGSVGSSVARELLDNGHTVLLIDKDKEAIRRDRVPGAQWLLSDACEPDGLAEANLDYADVVVAATGDDKTNLVLSLLAKTEFGVPRTVSRVNNPRNEWLFDDSWGVDVAVSTPRLLTALVEEAVEVGGLVHLMNLQRGGAALVEVTLSETAPVADQRVGDVSWPGDTVLVALVRQGRVFSPDPDDSLIPGDELYFLSPPESHAGLTDLTR